MSRFLLGGVIRAVVTLLLLSVVVFALARAPGDPLALATLAFPIILLALVLACQ